MGPWNWLKNLFGGAPSERPGDQPPLISLVLLLRGERYLDDQVLTDVVNRAWGTDLSTDDPDATDFVAGATPTFIVQLGARHILVNNLPVPYVKDVEAEAELIKELRLRRAFAEHRAWLSVDLLGDKPPPDLREVYRQIGKLIAELADQDCLALFSPATGQMIPWDDALDARLRGDDVLGVFNELINVPVVQVPEDDPRMQQAVAEARRRWPEFVAAFEERRADQRFAVKAPFGGSTSREFMWISVTAIEADRILGTLENDPVEAPGLRYGSKVAVKLADLNDWVISVDGDTIDDDIHGGFTIKVFKDLQ